ncbi:MAG: acyl-CoA reductase [Prevotellaceae bacterium]|jgi:hypothetical protein|nr:acyl-CoA reductase [Prevotellaceae bacterium]
MTHYEIICAFAKLGDKIKSWLHNKNSCAELNDAVNRAIAENEWFTVENIKRMLAAIALQMLDAQKLQQWTSQYECSEKPPKRVGIIAAGNIPLVFFHDFICVIFSKNIAVIKFSSKDKILPECVIGMLVEIEPQLKNFIEITEKKSFDADAVIATGNDNTLKFFQEKFENIPHIFRKNRTSFAIIKGDESREQIELLGEDMFSFFGLGCRNVSKLFVPCDYDFSKIIGAMEKFSHIKNHEPYRNAYIYNRALLAINGKSFIDNNFWLLTENFENFSPVSVVFYEKYSNLVSVKKTFFNEYQHIQCIVNCDVDFGKSQQPQLTDYADGTDVMHFLLKQI